MTTSSMRMQLLARMAPSQALGFLLFLTAYLVGSAARPSGYRLELTHVDSKGDFTKSELIRRAIHRSRLRRETLFPKSGPSSSSHTSPTWDGRPKLHWSTNEFIIELAIGTPPVPFTAIADTGSDLIWTQSRPCSSCAPQPTPQYNPLASFSFSPEPCSSVMCQGTPRYPLEHNCTTRPELCKYTYGYGDKSYSKGVLGRETLTFPTSTPGKFISVAGVAFGCGNENVGSLDNSTGLFGLGRGPLSFVAQMGFGKFSYCLNSYYKTKLTSPLLFGSLADLTTGGRGDAAVQTTPLVHVADQASLYYVFLEGISIGKTRLPIPDHVFGLKSDGSGGGMVVDSGSTITSLPKEAFSVLASYVSEMRLGQPVSNYSDCYAVTAGANKLPDMPDMVLHFAGADMLLHRDSYMIFYEDTSSICLAFEEDAGVSVLGNFQQQNLHVLYDITEGYLSFVPTDCSKL